MARERPIASDVHAGSTPPIALVPRIAADLDRRLTSAAPPAKRHPYDQWAPDVRALNIVGDKWTLLIVRDLAAGRRRFVELQRVLPGISTEQLRTRLKRMVADGLLTRQRYREVPPRVDYELTSRSKELLPVLGALGRWGHDWAWSAPREFEAIDIGAILRIAPGIVEPDADARGVARFTVHVDEATTMHYTLTVERGGVAIDECEPLSWDASVEGSQAGWIEALGPSGDLDGLCIEGDESLALLLLEGVCAGGGVRAGGEHPVRTAPVEV